MKTLLTVVVCGKKAPESCAPLYDGIELIYSDEGESEIQLLARAIRNAKGKYIVIPDGSFLFADVQSLLNIIDKNNADMVCFTDGIAIKTAIYRGIKDFTDSFSCRFFAVCACKTLLKTSYTPFKFDNERVAFSEDNANGLGACATLFGKVKAKLAKEIYTFTFNMLGERLVLFYLYTMLAIKDGNAEADKLIEFDNKLKAEIFLYLNLEKRFTYAKLQKLRDNGFKISWLTARKFRKILNK